jgi:hypothetical protein
MVQSVAQRFCPSIYFGGSLPNCLTRFNTVTALRSQDSTNNYCMQSRDASTSKGGCSDGPCRCQHNLAIKASHAVPIGFQQRLHRFPDFFFLHAIKERKCK